MKTHLVTLLLCLLCSVALMANDSTSIAFKRIDSIAINTPADLPPVTDSIAAYLVKYCTTDREKARAAFTWIANHISYDADAYNSGKKPDQSPAPVLRRKHAVCAGYTNLYVALCEAMHLEAVKIAGYSKGYSYKEGDGFKGKKPGHDWNAVKLDGRWALIDVTWGSGSGHKEQGELVHHNKFRPYYFDVDKYEFLFLHYPVDTQWLLIPESVSLAQFEDMPHIRASFFMLGFNAHDILTKFLSNKLPKDLPHAFSFDHQAKFVDFPLNGTLTANTQLNLTIISEEDLKFLIATDPDTKPVAMKKSGNQYTASILLKRGDLRIAIGTAARFYDILTYKVK
jgi:hypothetical protein